MAEYPMLMTALQGSSEAQKQLSARLKELEVLEIHWQQELLTYHTERERRELEFAMIRSEEYARRIQALQEYEKKMETHRHRLMGSISNRGPANF